MPTPPGSSRTDTLFPYPALFRSVGGFQSRDDNREPLGRAFADPGHRLRGGNGEHDPRADSAAGRYRDAGPGQLRAAERAQPAQGLSHGDGRRPASRRSEEHTSELQSLMRISYAVFCLKKKNKDHHHTHTHKQHNKPTHEEKQVSQTR